MTEFIIKKTDYKPKIAKAVLVEGLPGIGNVARLSVDYLIDKLGAKKLFEVFSDVFPNSVTVDDDSSIKMFSVEFFHARVEGKDLILLSGDVQPTSDAESFALCKKIIELVKELNVNEVITIGGIGLPENPDKVRVHCVVTDESLKKGLSDLGLIFDGSDTVKVILGATGLLLGVAKLEGVDGFSLLAETFNQPQHVGIKEAREVLKSLTNYLGFKLDFNELDEEVKIIEQEIKEDSKITDRLDRTGLSPYIG